MLFKLNLYHIAKYKNKNINLYMLYTCNFSLSFYSYIWKIISLFIARLNWLENRKSIIYTNIVINLKSLYYLLFLLSVAIAITPPRFAQIYESSINIEEITGELVLSFNEIPSARCRRHYQIIERCNSALSRCSLFFSFLFQSLSFFPYSPTRPGYIDSTILSICWLRIHLAK